jgi:hypothetical protein
MTKAQVDVIKEILEAEREFIKEAVIEAVDEKVNGSIVRLDKKLDDHIKAIEPFLSGIKGLKTLRSVTLWIAGTVVTIGSAILMIKQLMK